MTISAMNAPVFAALAPGVDVSGRIVSAISSSSATSAAVNVPTPCAIACAQRRVVEREREQRVAADQRDAAEQRVTRCIASRRVIRRGRASMVVPPSQVAALQLVDRERRRARGERHVGERRVLARRRGHARAVGDEHVRRSPTPGCAR